MHILYFGYNANTYEVKKIIESAKKNSHKISFFNTENLVFHNGFLTIKNQKIDLDQFDIAIVRSHGKIVQKKYQENHIATHQIIQILQNKNIPILNGHFFSVNPFFDKFSQSIFFNKNDIPTIPTIYAVNSQFFTEKYFLWSFPVIIKEIDGSFGLSVYKIDSLAKLKKFINEHKKEKIIVQKFIPNTCDYRVIVCGQESVGIMKRTSTKNDWLHNFSQGAKIEKIEDISLENFAKSVAKKLKCDYVGIDIIRDQNDNFLVVEINLSANFKGFENIHSENCVAEQIIKTLEAKKLY